jgi:hypothetical protein
MVPVVSWAATVRQANRKKARLTTAILLSDIGSSRRAACQWANVLKRFNRDVKYV